MLVITRQRPGVVNPMVMTTPSACASRDGMLRAAPRNQRQSKEKPTHIDPHPIVHPCQASFYDLRSTYTAQEPLVHRFIFDISVGSEFGAAPGKFHVSSYQSPSVVSEAYAYLCVTKTSNLRLDLPALAADSGRHFLDIRRRSARHSSGRRSMM
jgi:hypothetical protein